MAKNSLQKSYGWDPVIWVTVVFVIAVTCLFGIPAYRSYKDKTAPMVPVKRPLGLRMHIDHIKAGQKAAANKTSNQLADGSVTGTVFIGDFKITGLEDVTKKQ